MATNTAKLSAMLTADASGFVSAMSRAGASVENFRKRLRQMSRASGASAIGQLASGVTRLVETFSNLSDAIKAGEKNFADMTAGMLNSMPGLVGEFSRLGQAIGKMIFGDPDKQLAQLRAQSAKLDAFRDQTRALEKQLEILQEQDKFDKRRIEAAQKHEEQLAAIQRKLKDINSAFEGQARLEQRHRRDVADALLEETRRQIDLEEIEEKRLRHLKIRELLLKNIEKRDRKLLQLNKQLLNLETLSTQLGASGPGAAAVAAGRGSATASASTRFSQAQALNNIKTTSEQNLQLNNQRNEILRQIKDQQTVSLGP